jgi:uncharacterized protein (DUF1778 family)
MPTVINDRIDVRISREQKELIRYACDLRGFKNLSEFVVYCISKEANEIIIENSQVLKTLEDKKIFIESILNPPKPNAILKKAHLDYLNFINQNDGKNRKVRKKS